MRRVGARQPAPRRVSWAGKHSKIKQQVTRDRVSATAARGGKQQQRHEERGRKLCTSTTTERIQISVNGGVSARSGVRRKASTIPTTTGVRDDTSRFDNITIKLLAVVLTTRMY